MSTPSRIPAAIAAFDLAPVTRRLQDKGVVDAPALETEFRKVVTLWSVHGADDHCPSLAIDEYWHETILDTRRYAALCDLATGGFVEHVNADGESMDEAYARTVALYTARFGAPDPALWSAPGNSMSKRRT